MTVIVGIIALGLGLGASLFLPVPQNLKTAFDAGQSLYALGEYEGAILEYSKIVDFENGRRFSKAVRTDSVTVEFGDELELPVVPAAWYQLGNAYKKSGQHDEAVIAYHHVTEAEGVAEDFRSLVQFQVAETRFLQKEYDEAAKEYKHYVKLFPNSDVSGKAYFYAGWSEFNLKEYDQSIETLREMLSAYPEDRYASDSQFRIASALYEKGEYELAVNEAQSVSGKYPNSPVIAQAEYLKANAFDQMGKDQDAINSYREVRGLYNRMYELLRGSFREGKNVDFENYRQLFETSSLRVAEIFRKTDQFEEAYKELIAAQETAEERFYKAKVQMRIGDNFMEWKRFDDAWNSYNQVIELYADTPYPSTAQYYKGEARYFGSKYEDARTDYLKVLDDYPDSETSLRAASLYSSGWTSEKLAQPEEALRLYGQVVENFPRSDQAPLCLLRIGNVQKQQQRIPEAIEAFEAVAANYAETNHAADANYGMGLLYRDEGRTDEAVSAFSKVGRDAGRIYVAALIEAANIHIKEGRDEKGRGLLKDLLEGVTGDRGLEAMAHYQMAQLDLNNKSYGESLKRYTKVIDEYPESDVIRDCRYGRGLAFHYVGRYKNAVEDYKWLLSDDLPPTMKLKVEFSMALSYAAQGNDIEATKLLNQVIDSGDVNLARSARLQLISMAEKQDPQVAVRTYEDMLERLDSEEERVRVLTRLASAYFRLENYDRSIEASQQLIDLGASPESVSNAMFVQGNSYFKGKEYKKAIVIYKKLREDFPEVAWSKNALFQIGVSYEKLSRGTLDVLPLMSQTFTEYYTQYPEDDKAEIAYYYDAWTKWRWGRWRDASDTFSTLSKMYPSSPRAPEALFRSGEAVFNLATGGNREAKQKVYEEALIQYEEVTKRYPKSDYADDALYNKAWALISLSDIVESPEMKQQALPIFQEIVKLFPYERYGPQSQFTLGDYYYGEKDYENAAASYEKFLAIYPADKLKGQDKALRNKASVLLGHLSEIEAYELYTKGDVLFTEKKYEEAVKIFETVISKYPESDQAVNSLVNIGAAHFAEEEYRKAGEVFQQVVDKYGDKPKYSAQIDFARQQLQTLEEARLL